MREYKDGRGDYYLAAGKREERLSGPRTESGRRFLAGWLGKNTPTDDWWRAKETICEIEDEAMVARVHYGDPDDQARSYNQGYDDALDYTAELRAALGNVRLMVIQDVDPDAVVVALDEILTNLSRTVETA